MLNVFKVSEYLWYTYTCGGGGGGWGGGGGGGGMIF